jgi:acetyl coenzyme A synthetase (ADP forming)-like protein
MSDPTYPDHREADVVLHDGSTVSLRPVRPDDGEILEELFAGLDLDSQAFRFFSGAADLARAGQMMAEVDYRTRYGLLAFRGQDHRPVGHGVYLGLDPATAEVAFAVADEFQGRGLGTILLAHLAETAGENDIATFRAEVMPSNRRMIDMFRESGFPVEIESSRDGLGVEFPTSLTPDAIARFEQRDTLAARAAVDGFLRPQSVAIVGASRRRGTVGGEVLHNLIESPFDGPIYPVNPSSDSVQDVPAFASVAEIPEEIDLAVIAVRAEAVAETARECVAKGARSLVVLSAGFTEIGEDGPEREHELLAVCREAGLRLIGPNCLGILDTDPEDGLNVSFAPEEPVAGNVAFATQSGALGLALIEFAEARGIGVSTFASLGNRADMTATDLLEFWEEDESTRLALLYIESFSNPGRFARVARRVGRSKPVVVVKSGRSAVGARAATSHTGALLAASDRTVDALFEQCGVIRAETLSELLDVASLLSTQPLPAGHRVGIVTNAGGPAIMCADACDAIGLEVPPLPDELQAELASFLPAEASARNPIDMIATASAEQYRQTITAVAGWDGIDALISIYIKPLLSKPEDIAAAVAEAAGELSRDIPIQTVFISPLDVVPATGSPRLPTYRYPEDAARALGKAVGHVRWRQRPESPPPAFTDLRPDEAAVILAEALAAGREWLDMEECARVLDCYGIAMPKAIFVPDPAAAGEAAEEIGGPVALKAHGPEILHKTELGAVEVGLSGAAEVERAASKMDQSLADRGLERTSFFVQQMVEGGVELLVGIATDPVFGPVVACGAGGTAVELLGDVSVRVCPLGGDDAAAMVGSLAISPMLEGFRGLEPVDRGALEDLIARVGALAEAHREIVELDLNPVLARPDGAVAADSRIRIAPAEPPRPWPRTRA